MKKRACALLPGAVLLLLLCSLLPVRVRAAGVRTLYGSDSRCTRAVLAEHPGLRLQDTSRRLQSGYFSVLRQQGAVLCLELQTADGLQRWPEAEFLPQGLVTVVFLIDHRQTDLRPAGWQQLLEAGLKVSLPISGPRGNLLGRTAAASISYGLEGPHWTPEAAFRYLRKLYVRGDLTETEQGCPVAICFDAEAMTRAAADPLLEIVVPEDGTLSFVYGLLGSRGVEGASEEALLQSGLRLPDGRCLHPACPSAEAYTAAVPDPSLSRTAHLTENFTREFRRDVLDIRHFTPADAQENILCSGAILLLTIAWTAWALYRSTRQDMRRWIWLLFAQISLWVLLGAFKYMLPAPSLLTRICWYAYYIFLLGLPLTALHIAIAADQPAPKKVWPRWSLLLRALYPALLLLVFTNDLHQLVFRFDLSGNWSSAYTYGPGYVLIFADALLCFLLSLLLMIRKSRRSPRRYAQLGPVLTAALLILFNVCYVLDLGSVRESNLSMVFCLFSILFMETVLHAGLIPTNTRYRDFFASSPLNMQLVDRTGAVLLAASGAEPLTRLQRCSIAAAPGVPYRKDENTLLHSRPIHGGFAVWQEDISSVNHLQRQLRLSIEKNEKAAALLLQESEIRRRKLAAQVNDRLFNTLEADIEDRARELSDAVRTLPAAENRQTRIAYITLLLCHIKRRCNLFFLSQEGTELPGNELAVYTDELSEFAAYAGIRALVCSSLPRQLRVDAATLCYDFYFSLLSWAVRDSRAILIGRLEQQDGRLTFSILSSTELDSLVLPDAFLARAGALGAVLSRRTVEDSDGICLTFPQEGGNAR